ncbi:MAG: MFS transporter [Candidatus Binatia bacterium]
MVQMTGSQTLTARAAIWACLVTTSVAHMAEHLYIGIITVVLPVIAASLGLNMAQAGLLVSARALVAGLSNIPSGLLADLTGRRNLILGLCLVLLGSSSMLMSFAPDYWTLLVFMALGASGAGGFHPQSLSILSAAYHDRRALALGVHDSSGNLGEILAPLTIGSLLSFMSWRGTLQIWAIPGLTIGLLYALFSVEVNTRALSRASFGRSLRDHILTNRDVLTIFVISVFRTMGQTSLLAFLPLYMSLKLKLSAGAVGGYMSILFLFAALAPSFSGWVSDRVGRAPMLIVGLTFAAVSIAILPYLSLGIPLGIGLGIVGTALWAIRPVIFAAAMDVAPPQVAGTLVGFLFTGNMGLSSVSPILAGLIADAFGLAIALAFIGIFPLLACLVTLGSVARARA